MKAKPLFSNRLLVSGYRGGEEIFGAHDMDTALGINELCDIDVTGNRDKGVGVIAGEVGVVRILLGEEGDHVADGHLGGDFEVFVEAHGDVLGGGFGAGPEEMLVLMHDELEGTGELGFEGGDVDFAIALAGVTVADFKESALCVDGEEYGGASGKFLVVHVAAVHPGWSGVVASGGFGRCDAHATEEGMERNVDAGGEVADHLFAVERNKTGVTIGEVVGEKAAADAEGVTGPGDVDVDFLDAEFEDIARLGSIDGDGAGEDVAAGAFFRGGDFGIDIGDVGRDIGFGDAEGLEALGRAAGGEGLDGNGVAGFNGENGFGTGGVVAPGYCRGGGEEGLGGLLRPGRAGREKCSGAESS